MSSRKTIAIIGGGASALSVAAFLDAGKYDVTIYERNRGLGRKFLVAGKGGFNLTHSERVGDMMRRYSPPRFLDQALSEFDNERFRAWLSDIGIPTYVGSSRRVFPVQGIKHIEVLTVIKEYITTKGHKIRYDYKWVGWSPDGNLLFENGEKIESYITIFCMGGGSWKVTGSDGLWNEIFRDRGVLVLPFLASNCAYKVDWPSHFIDKASGRPLKNISLSNSGHQSIGEAMITDLGIEGSAVYALSDQIQSQLSNQGCASIHIDLKPMLTIEEIVKRIKNSKRKLTDCLIKDLKLEKVKVQLLKSTLTKEQFLDINVLAINIKELPILLEQACDIDKAISTTGGVDLSEIDDHFQLKKLSGNYVLGEMLDWNAPTGGYLLQACFSMGHHLALHLNQEY